MAETQTPFAPVLIGISPAGTQWIARKAADVAPMTERLAALTARHAAKQAARDAATGTRRVKLTPAQRDLVERFLTEDSTATLRKTYVETTEAELLELAELIDEETDDAMEDAASASMRAETDSEIAFAAIAGGMSCQILAAKLRGQRINKSKTRAKLAKLWN